MGVSVFRGFRLKENADKAVSCTFIIHHFQFLSIPDDHSNFKVFFRLLRNIIFWCNFILSVCFIDFDPCYNSSLAHFSIWVVQLPVLDWFLGVGLEVGAEVTIFDVNNCFSDEVVAEQQVIVPKLDLQEWATRENSLEVELLVDVWIRLI